VLTASHRSAIAAAKTCTDSQLDFPDARRLKLVARRIIFEVSDRLPNTCTDQFCQFYQFYGKSLGTSIAVNSIAVNSIR
jgi:hypothetical protein